MLKEETTDWGHDAFNPLCNYGKHEYCGKTKLITKFSIFGQWKIYFNDQNHRFQCWIPFQRCQMSIKVLMEKNQTSSFREKTVWKSNISILMEFFTLLGRAGLKCNNLVWLLHGEIIITNWNSRLRSCCMESSPYLWRKSRLNIDKKSKFMAIFGFSEFDAKKKFKFHVLKVPLQVEFCWLEILMRNQNDFNRGENK